MRVSSRSFKIPAPQAKLPLSLSGDSALVFFDLNVERTGRQALDVDLIFRGNLLQSRRVEVEVVAHSADTVPESAWPVQDGYITFTRTAALAPGHLASRGDGRKETVNGL